MNSIKSFDIILLYFRDFGQKSVKVKRKRILLVPKKLVIWNGRNGLNVVLIVDGGVEDERRCAHYQEVVKASCAKIWIWKIKILNTFKIAILGTGKLAQGNIIIFLFGNDSIYCFMATLVLPRPYGSSKSMA